VAYTDHEIGRVIQAVEDLGKLDNTLIIYISGDNGTSAEGSAIGTPFDLAAIPGDQRPGRDAAEVLRCPWVGPDHTSHVGGVVVGL
jgi:arylsulfatase